MKISKAIEYLSEYQNKDEEIMISWNDRDFLSEIYGEEISDKLWSKAVLIHSKYADDSFNDECVNSLEIAQEKQEQNNVD